MRLSRRGFLVGSLWGAGALASGRSEWLFDEGKPGWPEHPFLRDNFFPVHAESDTPELKVIGEIPKELSGHFLRTGPNPQFPPLGRYHWFDGDGMIHAVRFENGRASYRNRYVRTEAWREERAVGRSLYGGILEPPLPKFRQGKLPVKNSSNTALVAHHGRLLSLWEGGEPHALRLPNLETEGSYPFGWSKAYPFTAHPKIDRDTGELFYFGYRPMFGPHVQYGVADASGRVTHTTTIPVTRSIMMHDFAVTKHHALFLDLPATFSFVRAIRGEPVLKFEPELGARIGVLPRYGNGRDIRWFEIEPCWVFHTFGAFERGDVVTLVACRWDAFPGALESNAAQKAVLYRWSCDLSTGRVQEQAMDDRGIEFPRSRDVMLVDTERFGYAATDGDPTSGGIVKYDLHDGRAQEHRHGKGRTGGEAVFVPRPGSQREDDGWLMTFVFDQTAQVSELILVSALDVESPPIARILIPFRVPYGFHGLWVADGLQSHEAGS